MKKNYLLIVLTTTMVAMLSVGFASCGDDEESVVPPQNDGNQQTEYLSNQDPEGTVVINMNNGANDNYYDLGLGYKIHIDEANNFISELVTSGSPYGGPYTYYPVEFVTIGTVKGLSEVNTIPETGWSTSVAVVPGTGYVVRVKGSSYSYDKYARLYVVESIVGTSGGIIGATIKYQSPFARTIKLEKSSLTFSSAASSQTVNLVDPTAYTVSECPTWCTVSSNTNPIQISVTENLTTQRSGNIVLKNSVSTVSLDIVQNGSSTFEGGNGTETDPYQIKTAQHLQNVNLRPNLHYILISDINLSSYLNTSSNGWNPIGTSDKPFTGTFNGQNHIISGIWINKPTINNVGLFGYISNSAKTIKNIVLKIDNKGIVGSSNVGGISGFLSGEISDCIVDGTVSGDDYVGGICGGAEDYSYYVPFATGPNSSSVYTQYASSNISNCISKGVIKSSGSNRGGILGGTYYGNYGYGCSVNNCSTTATLQDK